MSEFSAAVLGRIESIDYDNFKASVPDVDLQRLYEKFWALHREYQEHWERRRARFAWGPGDLEKVDDPKKEKDKDKASES